MWWEEGEDVVRGCLPALEDTQEGSNNCKSGIAGTSSVEAEDEPPDYDVYSQVEP